MHRDSFAARLSLVLFGLLLAAAAIEVSLRVAGLFVQEARQGSELACGLPPQGVKRILCIGESTTAPTGRGEADHSWPKELERLLSRQAPTQKFEVINRGTIAINSAVLLSLLPQYLDCYHPDLLISMVGVNDDRWYGRWAAVQRDDSFSNFLRRLKIVKLALFIRYEGPWARRAGSAAVADAPDDPKPRLTGLDDLSQCRVQYPSFEYVDWSKTKKLIPVCSKAMALRPEDYRPYYTLGMIYREFGQRSAAEKLLEQARRLGGLEAVAFPLSWIYSEQKKYAQAEELLKKAIEQFPQNQTFPMRLSRVYDSERRYDQSERMFVRMANSGKEASAGATRFVAQSGDQSPTAFNYRQIRLLARRRGIPLVAMQYPGRPLSMLQGYFPEEDGIIWVDNEPSFLAARRPGKYSDYYVDRFADTWGHCTPKGNQLIAANVVRALRENGIIRDADEKR